ncbi:MAG: ABC transporter permease [Calditrichia bacterium]
MKWLSLFSEYIFFAFKSLFSHKLRSFLTILGIIIGVTTIITIFTTIEGLNRYVKDNFSSIGGTSTIYISRTPWVIMGDWWKYRNRPKITIEHYYFLKKHAKVAKYISPTVDVGLVVKGKEKTIKDVLIEASNADYLYLGGIELDTGRFVTDLDFRAARPVCVIGAKLAELLFQDQSPLGNTIKIGGKHFKVVGVLEKRGSVFGFDMDKSAIVPYFSLRNIIGPRRGIQIALSSGDPSLIPELKEETRYLMRRARGLKPSEEDNFSINQQDMLTDFYMKLTGTLYSIIFVIGSVSLLVGGIVITNIMLVSVTERTKEIGIRKAIGASRKAVLTQFLLESITISVIGGLIGLIFGYLGAVQILHLLKLEGFITLNTIILAIGFSSFTGIVAGFYPAMKAARMNPIDALRYE